MKIKIYPKNVIEIGVPEYAFKAYSDTQFLLILENYIKEVMMEPSWYIVDRSDIDEARVDYKRRRKGLDKVEMGVVDITNTNNTTSNLKPILTKNKHYRRRYPKRNFTEIE